MYKIPAKTLFLGKDLKYLPSCHSTNDIASDLIEKNTAKNGMVVITDHQTNGKGQRGNVWISAPEENLTFSMVLIHKQLEIHQQFNLTLIVSISIIETLKELGVICQIKWPNDIYYGNKKVGGILINNSIQGNYISDSVVGVGLNVNQSEFEIATATSLKNISGRFFDNQVIFERLLEILEVEWLKFTEKGIGTLKMRYFRSLLGFGKWRTFQLLSEENKHFTAKIVDIGDLGRLKVELQDGTFKEFDLKELGWLFEG